VATSRPRSSVEPTNIRSWLYGGAALAVRGFDIEPADIDINVSDAKLTGHIFDDLMVTPAG
jgi:hypothetical protein